MSTMFKSLMLGYEGEEVTSEVELLKANEALSSLSAVTQAIPSVRAVARQKLAEAIARLSKEVDIDKVYINRGEYQDNLASRPTGSLAEVLVHCLEHHVLLSYIQGDDGVYHVAETRDDRFKVQGLQIVAVEDAITGVLRSLSDDLRSALDKHWKGTAVTAGGALNNKNALQEEVTKVLMGELSLSVIAGALKEHDALRVAELMGTDTPAFFRIETGSKNALEKSLSVSFVVDRSFSSLSEIKPDRALDGWILYTLDNGFEYFSSSLQMHETLCRRFSLSASEITYPLISKSVFSYYVDKHLQEQRAAVSRYVAAQKEKRQDWLASLESNQKLGALWESVSASYGALKTAIKRSEWPQWLKKAGENAQQRYLELEYSKECYEFDYQPEFDRLFSLQDYVSRTFSEWARSVLGEQLNPDTIKVRSLYKMKVGERSIEQKDTRTLTEFLLVGLHDSGQRAELVVEGAPAGSRLVQGWLESWLNNRDMRAEFVASIPATVPVSYRTALANCLHSRMEFALFVARHRGIYNDAEVAMIKRAMAGESGILIKGVKIDKLNTTPLKDVLVFLLPNSPVYYVYLKTPENTFEFLRFSYAKEFIEWLGETMSRDRRYAESIIWPSDLDTAGLLSASRGGQLEYRYYLSYSHPELKLDAKQPLLSYVDFLYNFEVALHSEVAPLAYRRAGPAIRQRFARLDTEFRALATIDARENTFPLFEIYTRDLIKSRLEAVLKMKGEVAEIDPDRIMVQTDDFTKDLTSVLVEELTFEAPHPAYQLPGSNPKFYLKAGHPAVSKLDIRDLAHLSVTLHPDDKYTQMLKDDYRKLGTPEYEFKRAVHGKKIRCEMEHAVLFHSFNGHISLQMLPAFQRVIDRLAEKGDFKYSSGFPVAGEGIFSFSLLGDRVVEGVYVFHLAIAGKLLNYLYTPNAPDQKTFRPIEDFVNSIRHRDGPFREYYINRVLIEDQKVVNDYFDNLVVTVDTVAPLQPNYRYRVVDLHGFHSNKIERALRNIDERTTSLKEFIGGLVCDVLMTTAGIIGVFVPPVGMAVTAVTMLKSGYSASQAYRRGDYSGALWHGKDMLVALVSLGKAASSGAITKGLAPPVTRAQLSLFSVAKDAKEVTDLVAKVMGRESVKELLHEYIKGLMAEHQTSQSQTTLY